MMVSVSFSKLPAETRNFVLDFSASLSATEQITSFTGLTISPTDVSLTVTPSITAGGKSLTVNIVGGTASKSYVITVSAVTSLAQVIQHQIGLTLLSTSSVFQVDSGESIPRLSGKLAAGDSVLGNTILNFPAGSSLSGGSLSWSLLDNAGILHASGFGDYTLTTSVNGTVLLNGTAVISTPSDLASSSGAISYQLRWSFAHSSLAQAVNAYETITVLSNYETAHGIQDVIELQGTTAVINCVLERAYDNVFIEVYDRFDALAVGPLSVKATETQLAGGSVAYTASVDTTLFNVDMVPRTVAFKYSDGLANAQVNRTFGRLYVVTPSTLAACEDLRTFINRTNTTIVGQPDMVFTTSALLTFMRMGKDYFNMIFMITNFTMARASGGIRDGWIKCSSIQALRSQFIAEGEQAFDYQGQAISLTVDRTQYYDSLASNLEGQLEMYSKFKSQLTKRGIVDGDGDLDNTAGRFGNIAAVGLNATPISCLSMSGYRRRLPLF